MRGLRLVTACAIALLVAAGAAEAGRRAIVVLGAAARADGRPGPALTRRLETALALARKDPRALVVVSGGAVANEEPEAAAMARWLAARGIDPARVVVEPAARNTRENADRSVALLRGADLARVTVVTERFHLRRGLYHLRAALRNQGLREVSVDGAAAPDGLTGLRLLRRTLAESKNLARDALWRLLDRSPFAAALLQKGVRSGLVRVEGGGATRR